MARRSQNRKQTREVYVIVVDGDTEVWYFQLMKRHESLRHIDIKPEIPKKKRLEDQYKAVCDFADLYDKVIWIIDLDVVLKETHEATRGKQTPLEELKGYFKKLRKRIEKKEVEILINTPGFEYWHLLHFDNKGKQYSSCDAVIKDLRKQELLKAYEKKERYYKEGKQDLYQKLRPYLSTAIANAKKLGDFDFGNPEAAKVEM